MNIARWFSYTLRVEAELAEWKARARELEEQLEDRTQYAFALTGRPSPDLIKARIEAAASGTQAAEVKPVRTNTNLRLIRRSLVKDIIAKREPKDGPLKPEMEARADEFAEKVKDGKAS